MDGRKRTASGVIVALNREGLMAKAKTATAPKKVKKAAKAVKAVAKAAPKAVKKNKAGKSKTKNAADALWKLAEHPMVAELLAIGATAAVAEIAEQGFARRQEGQFGCGEGCRRGRGCGDRRPTDQRVR